MLRLENVSLYYNNGDTVAVGVSGISLSFQKGEFALITGESGSGKSSLLNIISFTLPYHDGEMYMYGNQTSAFDEEDRERYRREKIGFVFQNYNLIESYTAVENVMSAMLLQGITAAEAREKAGEYLDRVGLGEFKHRRATKLSSGQKQRLSIARALAKETDILVADEPTGNLDSETGRQIVELLASIAREKLVIMVSHNIAEAEEFATRRIRLHDGAVVADEVLRPAAVVSDGEDKPPVSIPKRRLALQLSRFNIAAQPRKTVIVILFLLITALASFVFAGSFLSALDESASKVYDNRVFRNGEQTRIVVRRIDGEQCTEADLSHMRAIKHVDEVDMYDYVNDCNYYYVLNDDHAFFESGLYLRNEHGDILETFICNTLKVLRSDRFMRTSTCLTEADLSAGRLPVGSNEIVLYSDDPSVLDTTISVHFRDTVAWNALSQSLEMTVTGILAKPTEQIYFSPMLARAFIYNRDDNFVELYYDLSFIFLQFPGVSDDALRTFTQYIKHTLRRPVLFPDQTLGAGEIRVSAFAYSPFWSTDNIRSYIDFYNFPLWDDELDPPRAPLSAVTMVERSGYLPARSAQINADMLLKVLDRRGIESHQMSVYIEDYAYMDDAIRAIHESGEYYATSPFRAGSIVHSPSKVKARLITLGVSAGAFLMMFAMEIIVLCALLRFKQRDFSIFRSLGMDSGLMHSVNAYELFGYGIIALALAAGVIMVARIFNISYLENIVKYYRWYHILALVACNLLVVRMLVNKVNGDLDKLFSGVKKRGARRRRSEA